MLGPGAFLSYIVLRVNIPHILNYVEPSSETISSVTRKVTQRSPVTVCCGSR